MLPDSGLNGTCRGDIFVEPCGAYVPTFQCACIQFDDIHLSLTISRSTETEVAMTIAKSCTAEPACHGNACRTYEVLGGVRDLGKIIDAIEV